MLTKSSDEKTEKKTRRHSGNSHHHSWGPKRPKNNVVPTVVFCRFDDQDFCRHSRCFFEVFFVENYLHIDGTTLFDWKKLWTTAFDGFSRISIFRHPWMRCLTFILVPNMFEEITKYLSASRDYYRSIALFRADYWLKQVSSISDSKEVGFHIIFDD